MDASVERIAVLIEQRCVGGVALLAGISLGGYTSMELARRRPHLVRGMLLSGCTADLTQDRSDASDKWGLYGRYRADEAPGLHAMMLQQDQRPASDPHVNELREVLGLEPVQPAS